MATQTAQMGRNRTGIGMAPRMRDEMTSGAQAGGYSSAGDAHSLDQIRNHYLREGMPIGSAPMPSSIMGAAKAGMEALKGNRPSLFLDKLGERLAFERSGVRFYEAILARFNATGAWDGGPTRERLQHFHDEELNHYRMLQECIESLGGDPTAVTPAADVMSVSGQGLLQVITDARTTMAQSLEALLTIEMTDNSAWEMLIRLAKGMGQDKYAQSFGTALKEEEEHLNSVHQWLNNWLDQSAKRDLS